jgi:hypothetical protein
MEQGRRRTCSGYGRKNVGPGDVTNGHPFRYPFRPEISPEARYSQPVHVNVDDSTVTLVRNGVSVIIRAVIVKMESEFLVDASR